MEKELKVAIYCRVSSSMQSIDRQRTDLIDLANRLKYTIDEKYIYVDVITGFSVAEDRPRYSEMLHEIEKGNINIVLISELTRLGRNSAELLSEIQKLQKMGVELYFEKQDLWIKNEKKDLGTRILLAVLAVTTSYEIELFAERSISGKINKIQKGGGVSGDSRAYGYKNVDKKIVVRDEEAIIVKKIFEMYASGKSVIEICDILNSDKSIPSPYTTRIDEFRETRKQKGLPPKEYEKIDVDKLKWRQSTISRMLANELYKGNRETIFRKPSVDKLEEKENKNGKKEAKKREIIYKYKEHVERLRIVSDELFQQVQDRLAKAKYNKNNSIKHENLLKAKLICGECGSNFSVGKQNDKNKELGTRSYKCYGRINRIDHKRICDLGAEFLQSRLDGLVLQLSLQLFAEINMEETNSKRIQELNNQITEYQEIVDSTHSEKDRLEKEYKKIQKRFLYMDEDDDTVKELIKEEKEKHDNKKMELERTLSKYSQSILRNRNTISNLLKLSSSFISYKDNMEQIRNNRVMVKNMVEEYIQNIFVFRIHKLWNLIIVKYTNDEEAWGTIKNARYKKEEMFYDPLLCRYGNEYQGWMINNSEHCFSYDKVKHSVLYNGESQIYRDIPKGEYDYEQFQKILKEKEWIGSYPLYLYEEPATHNEQTDKIETNTGLPRKISTLKPSK